MAPSVEKKIAELEMGLLHLQQNIEIPEISLLIHPIITNIAKQCYEHGEKPKVTDFGEKVEDPTFLNQLQSGVNRWIREIQKVSWWWWWWWWCCCCCWWWWWWWFLARWAVLVDIA